MGLLSELPLPVTSYVAARSLKPVSYLNTPLPRFGSAFTGFS